MPGAVARRHVTYVARRPAVRAQAVRASYVRIRPCTYVRHVRTPCTSVAARGPSQAQPRDENGGVLRDGPKMTAATAVVCGALGPPRSSSAPRRGPSGARRPAPSAASRAASTVVVVVFDCRQERARASPRLAAFEARARGLAARPARLLNVEPILDRPRQVPIQFPSRAAAAAAAPSSSRTPPTRRPRARPPHPTRAPLPHLGARPVPSARPVLLLEGGPPGDARVPRRLVVDDVPRPLHDVARRRRLLILVVRADRPSRSFSAGLRRPRGRASPRLALRRLPPCP